MYVCVRECMLVCLCVFVLCVYVCECVCLCVCMCIFVCLCAFVCVCYMSHCVRVEATVFSFYHVGSRSGACVIGLDASTFIHLFPPQSPNRSYCHFLTILKAFMYQVWF